MALNFPSNPNVGDQYISSNTIWTWDGAKWTASGLSEAYLPLVGGTMTGSLILKGDPTANLEATTKQYTDTKLSTSGGTVGPNSLIVNGPTQFNNYAAFSGSQPAVFNTQAQFKGGATFDSGQTFFNAPVVFSANAQGVTPPTGDNSQLLATTAWVNGFLGAQNRNRLINGNFLVNQWNNSASFTPTSTQYLVDRWRCTTLTQPSKFTSQISPITSGGAPAGNQLFLTSSSAYVSVAADVFSVMQLIEYVNIADFGWGTANARPATLSFWAAASVPGTYGGTIRNGAATRTYPFTFNLSNAGWNYITINIPGDTAGTWAVAGNAAGLGVVFDLGSGATALGPPGVWSGGAYNGAQGETSLLATNGAILQITNVQLELGSQATPFDWRPVGEELLLCQRYYQTPTSLINPAYNGAGGASHFSWMLPVQMRAVPTVAFNNITYSNTSALTMNAVSNTSLRTNVTVTAAGYGWCVFNATLSAEL